MGVGALKAEECNLQAKFQQPTGCVEVVVSGGRQQVNVGCVSVEKWLDISFEAVLADAEAQANPCDQSVHRGEQICDGQGRDPGSAEGNALLADAEASIA